MVPEKKKRGPAPTGKGQSVNVRLLADLLSPLDEWIAQQPGEPTRPEAIRFALKEWLKAKGYLK